MVEEDHQCYVAGIDGNVAEPADTAAVVEAPEAQNSARNENHDSLDYTCFQCKLYIQLKPAIKLYIFQFGSITEEKNRRARIMRVGFCWE